MVLIIFSCLDLLGVVLAFWISIVKKISNVFETIDTGLQISQDSKKFLRSFSELLSKFGENRFKNIFLKGSLTGLLQRSSLQTMRAKGAANYVSSGSKIVKRLQSRKYYPLIINRKIGIALGPSLALNRYFQKHCILTNKAVGTIKWDWSKPSQRRQDPNPRPLWLTVRTASVLGP